MPGYMSLVFDCANCGRPDVANPILVLSIPARREGDHYVPDPNGPREPICRNCALQALERIRSDDPTLTSVSPELRSPDYFDRAYGTPAAEIDL